MKLYSGIVLPALVLLFLLVKGSYDKNKKIEELESKIKLLKELKLPSVTQVCEKKTYMFS